MHDFPLGTLTQVFSFFFTQIVLAATLAVAAAAPGYLGASPYLAGPAVLPGYAAAPLVKGYGPLAYGLVTTKFLNTIILKCTKLIFFYFFILVVSQLLLLLMPALPLLKARS